MQRVHAPTRGVLALAWPRVADGTMAWPECDKVIPLITGAVMSSAIVRPVTVKIDQDTAERLKHLAEARQRTPHWLMREAIAQYVVREEKLEAYRQDGIKAWEDYQRTGLHATAAQADAWLAQLEQGQDDEPPECHS
jgi:predicted transcriptional regulator